MSVSNTSALNDSNSLQNSLNIFGINTKNKTITGDRFYVGEGILRCDNYFLSLDSICTVELSRRQNSVASLILFIIMGIIVFILSLFLCVLNTQIGVIGILIGILIAALGFLGICFIRKENKKIPYSMVIHLSDNSTYTYYSLNKNFLLDVIEVIQACINDRRGGYNILMNQGIIEQNNNSVNISNLDSFSGNIIGAGGSNTISGNGDNVVNKSVKNNDVLTAEEWLNLEKFFMMRRQEFPEGDRNYKICNNLVAYSQRKDASTIKKYLQTIGKEAVKVLFAASTNVAAMQIVKPIINKILKVKE